MAKKEPTYREAAAEIDHILSEIEDETEIDIDELAGKVERAAHLIQLCMARLKGAETRVRKITDDLQAMREDTPANDEAAQGGANGDEPDGRRS